MTNVVDQKSTDSLTFNYSDIFFSYLFNNSRKCTQAIREHTLIYVYSGQLVVNENDKLTTVNAGESIFLRRNNRVSMDKCPKGDNQFSGIFMIFKRQFLRDLYHEIEKNNMPQITEYISDVFKLPDTPDIQSLFKSMIPYFDTSVKPSDRLMDLKQEEGVYSLLNIDNRFYPTLFDFNEVWKTDILDFMENNYMYDLTIEDIAHFTGRSLSTFKRDFAKVSDLSPQRWLIERRLKAAMNMITNEQQKISDVYLEVGFKNLSHFSSAFKKHFGYSPSKIEL